MDFSEFTDQFRTNEDSREYFGSISNGKMISNAANVGVQKPIIVKIPLLRV